MLGHNFASMLVVALSSAACHAQTALTLATQRGCTACHALDAEVVGPSFKAIATRYASRPEAYAGVVRSVRLGSFKRWGDTPMPGDMAPEKDVRLIVRWILDQAPAS